MPPRSRKFSFPILFCFQSKTNSTMKFVFLTIPKSNCFGAHSGTYSRAGSRFASSLALVSVPNSVLVSHQNQLNDGIPLSDDSKVELFWRPFWYDFTSGEHICVLARASFRTQFCFAFHPKPIFPEFWVRVRYCQTVVLCFALLGRKGRKGRGKFLVPGFYANFR